MASALKADIMMRIVDLIIESVMKLQDERHMTEVLIISPAILKTSASDIPDVLGRTRRMHARQDCAVRMS